MCTFQRTGQQVIALGKLQDLKASRKMLQALVSTTTPTSTHNKHGVSLVVR
jgi:hypothetical protein